MVLISTIMNTHTLYYFIWPLVSWVIPSQAVLIYMYNVHDRVTSKLVQAGLTKYNKIMHLVQICERIVPLNALCIYLLTWIRKIRHLHFIFQFLGEFPHNLYPITYMAMVEYDVKISLDSSSKARYCTIYFFLGCFLNVMVQPDKSAILMCLYPMIYHI